MKAKYSPLEMIAFELLQSYYRFVVPTKKKAINPEVLFSEYEVDIDFNHREIKGDRIQVFVKVEINNQKNQLAGYSMIFEGMGIFKLTNTQNVSEEVVGNLKYYSSLNIMINTIRNIMFQTSYLGPLGPYNLPTIDILDLFNQKKKRSQVHEAKI
jgi:preprotein translocase subunit SecB